MTAFVFAVAMTALGVNGPKDVCLDWDAIDWRKDEDDVRRLRQRILKASQAGDLKQVRNLQKLMLRSRANTLISVRQVTERNAGRSTAGVDGGARTDFPGQGQAGRRDPRTGTAVAGAARQTGVYTEEQRKAARAGHSRDHGPVSAVSGS